MRNSLILEYQEQDENNNEEFEQMDSERMDENEDA
jgi:hypothetical protein